jgi:hypothetical protein
MPADAAKDALSYMFDLLAANGFVGLLSSEVGHS